MNRQQRRAEQRKAEKGKAEKSKSGSRTSASDPNEPGISAKIDAVLEAAWAHQQKNEFADADRMYRKVLEVAPNNPDALHLRGLLAYQTGNGDAALHLLQHATNAAGKLRIKTGGEAAEKVAGIWASFALVLDAANRAEAGDAYRKSLTLNPKNAEVFNNYGAWLKSTGDAAGAENGFRQALAIDPALGPALGNLATLLYETARFEEAALALRHALEVTPGDATLLIDLGTVLQRIGRMDEAVACFAEVLAAEPENPSAHINMTAALFRLEDFDAALPHAKKGVELAPDHPAAHNNLGNVLGGMEQNEAAEAAFKRAIELDPNDADPISNLGHLYKQTARLAEALTCYEKATEIAPANPRHRFGLSLTLMGLGRLEDALDHHDAGFDCGERRPDRRGAGAPWKGEKLDGKTLFLWPEQGIGDEIRYLSVLEEVAARAQNGPNNKLDDKLDEKLDDKLGDEPGDAPAILVQLDPRLVPIAARSFPFATVEAEAALEIGPDMVQASLGQAHDIVRRSVKDFDRQKTAFLKPAPDLMEKWQARRAALGPKPAVGLAWRSGIATQRRGSTLTVIEDWAPLLTRDDITLVALQYGEIGDDLAYVEKTFGRTLVTWDDLNLKDDIDDILALCANLDQVASVSTSLGDMAACVGAPTAIVLPEGQWVTLGTDRHPWYPSVTFYQRPIKDGWNDTITRIAENIRPA